MGKRNSITLVQFIVSCVLTLINTGCLIAYSIQNDWARNHLYLTKWSLYLNSFFMLGITLCDILLFFHKNSLEEFNDILRNKIGPSLNGISHVVMVFYWILLAAGGIKFTQGGTFMEVVKNAYTHGLISFFLIADIFVNYREKIEIKLVNIMGTLAFFLMYGIIIVIECYVNMKEVPYPFMDSISTILLCVFAVVIFGAMILGYWSNILLVKLKYKYNIFVDNKTKIETLTKEIEKEDP